MAVLRRVTGQLPSLLAPGANFDTPYASEGDTWLPVVTVDHAPEFSMITKGAYLSTVDPPPGYAQYTVYKPDPDQKNIFATAAQAPPSGSGVGGRTVVAGNSTTNVLTTDQPHGLQRWDRLTFNNDLVGSTTITPGVDYYVGSLTGLGTKGFKLVTADMGSTVVPIGGLTGGTFVIHGYAGGRPRCMLNLSEDTTPLPLPDNTPSPYDFIDGYDPVAAAAVGLNVPTETWYETYLRVPTGTWVPPGVGGVPAVWYANHGVTGSIVNTNKATKQLSARFDYPTTQFQLQRLTDASELGMYIRYLGGRYAPKGKTAPFQPEPAWDYEGLHAKPSVAASEPSLVPLGYPADLTIGNWYLETDRWLPVFEADQIPFDEWIYVCWAVRWSDDPTLGRFRLWTLRETEPYMTKAELLASSPVIDTTSTHYYGEPDGNVLVDAAGVPVPIYPGGIGGATVYKNPSYPELVKVGHKEIGLYRPSEGKNTSFFQTDVFDDAFHQTAYMVADSSDDLTGPIASAPATDPPVNTLEPFIAGDPVVGGTLTCVPGEWSGDAPITFTYQWQLDTGSGFQDISEQEISHLTAPDEIGHAIRTLVTATNPVDSVTVATDPVTVQPLPWVATTVTIPGFATVDIDGVQTPVLIGD